MVDKRLCLVLFSFACSSETPDDVWSVNVTGLETTCVESEEGYQSSHNYELYYTGSEFNLDVDGEWFATGQVRGCTFEYESVVYLDEAADGLFRWQITGTAQARNRAGGCNDTIPEGFDWSGTETLTVVSSDADSIEEGCTYEMQVEGTYFEQ